MFKAMNKKNKLWDKVMKVISIGAVLTMVMAGCSQSKSEINPVGSIELLNVSYDPTRELYAEYNESFSRYWNEKTGQNVIIHQSNAGSSKQARAVIDGLEADIVTLGLGYDIDAIEEAGLIDEGWQTEFSNNSAPYNSTVVFLVRKGNPKNIRDWDDLIREGISVITSNPKTSSGARWNYLAAWAYALEKFEGDEEATIAYIKEVYAHVEVLDSGSRGATTTFVERGIGDVLLAWENEAYLSINELGDDQFEIVVPSMSILAEPPVAIVDQIVDKRGTREVAQAYLEYLYSKEGQEIAAKNYYRPIDAEIAKKYEHLFPEVKRVTVDEVFGGWTKTQEKHFADNGIFDQIYIPTK